VFRISLTKNEWRLLIGFLFLCVPLVLYIARSLDDNRLTSWQWVFATKGVIGLFVFSLLGVVVALPLSLLSFSRFRVLFLFLLSFCLGALFWSEPEVIVDAARYFSQAKHLELFGIQYFFREWGKNIFAWTDLPLLSFCYGLIFKYFGETRIFIQFFNTILFSLSVVLVYQLGKTLWDEEVGYCAGLLLLAFPYLYTQVPLMLVDVPTMFFFLAAVWAFTRAMQCGGNGRIILAAVLLCLAILAKYSSWPFLSVLAVIFLIYLARSPQASLKRVAALVLCCLLPLMMFFISQQEVVVQQIKFLAEYQKPGLERWGESFISTFFFQIHPVVSLAALASLGVALKKRDIKYVGIAWVVLLVLVMQIKRCRYLIPIFPMVALMAAYGVCRISDRRIRMFVVFAAINTSLVVALMAYRPFLLSMGEMNLKDAGQFIDTLAVDGVEVLTPITKEVAVHPKITVPLLDLHTDKKIVYQDLPVSRRELDNHATSPLRFTWEFQSPKFYENGNNVKPGALVVVSDSPELLLPPAALEKIKDFSRIDRFQKSTGVFLHQTFVAVYHN